MFGSPLLEAREKELQLVTDTMSVGVARISRTFTYLWVNRVYAEWVGRKPAEIIGRTIAQVLGEEAMQSIEPRAKELLAGRRVQYERLSQYPAHGRRWVQITAEPTYGASGKPDGWVTVVSDIHDRKLDEDGLRQAGRNKDDFLAVLAHELRNPLAPIRNALAILGKKDTLDPEVTWSREVIDRQVGQLARLVDDLLDIGRIARGRLALRKQRVALERVVDMALETSRPHINAAGHRLSVILPAEPAIVDGDPARLAQVFANLLNNAARYTEPQGAISLSAAVEGGQAVVSVEDSGIGFSEEAAARLFEPFSPLTSASGRMHGGLGIGLSLVQGIVALHGGSVEARSDGPGRGSQFVVRLPLARGAYQEEESPRAATAAMSAAGRRVLVADDNKDSADSLQRVLQLYGYDVRVAYDGAAALRLGASFRPEVAVLDIGMPGANGYDVAREIRRQQGARIKLVALTGWGQEGDRRRAMEAGFDFHLTKPVDPGVLNDLLADVPGREM
ncbi:MAG TPA: ATP-binding protein [Burkholderiales bacterium]